MAVLHNIKQSSRIPVVDVRKDYTHTVRSAMSNLKRRGIVEHRGKGKRPGIYQVTDSGLSELSQI